MSNKLLLSVASGPLVPRLMLPASRQSPGAGCLELKTNLRMELFQALFITHGFQWDGELIFPLVQITLYLVRSLWLDSKHLRIMDYMIRERWWGWGFSIIVTNSLCQCQKMAQNIL